jgi:tRNA pseudouridine38-40 synthase
MNEKAERNFSSRVAYDGTSYAGFQLQPDEPTIQGALEVVLGKVLGCEVRVHGASRTDAGVHALGQVISFRCATVLPAREIERAANALLDQDIRMGPVVERDDEFHARFSAERKRYAYRIYRGERESPFLNRYALWVNEQLNPGRMMEAASVIHGRRDYRSFSSRLHDGEDPVKELEAPSIEEHGDLVEITMSGSGFLYQMARRITAVILKAGRAELEIDVVAGWLENPETGACKCIVPAKGLFLMEVNY